MCVEPGIDEEIIYYCIGMLHVRTTNLPLMQGLDEDAMEKLMIKYA
jgi:hypothetical protein